MSPLWVRLRLQRKRRVAGSKSNRVPKRLAIFVSDDMEVGSDGSSPKVVEVVVDKGVVGGAIEVGT